MDRVAAGLDGLGVRQKDFVVVHLTNCPEFLVAWFAFARLGATLVPSNTANTVAELEHIIGFSGARLAITEPAFLDTVTAGIAAAGGDAQVIVARGRAEGLVAFDDLAATPGDPPSPHVASLDLAELIFTSGTTRKPKAVMLTHAHCLRAGLDSVHCLWLDEGERCLTALPMFHVNAQAMSLLGTLTVGGTLIMLEEFRATKFWTQVRAHGATQTCLVAMQLRTILAQPPAPAERDHKVRRAVLRDQRHRPGEAGVRGALRGRPDQRLRALGGDDAAHLRADRRPAALAVDRPGRPRAAACCSSTTTATRSRRARSARSWSRGPRAATCCSATTATTTPPGPR